MRTAGFVFIFVFCLLSGVVKAAADPTNRPQWLSQPAPPDNFHPKSPVGPMEEDKVEYRFYTVKKDGTALKAEPNEGAATIMVLDRDSYVVIEGHVPLLDSNGGLEVDKMYDDRNDFRNTYWYKARVESGARGFLHGLTLQGLQEVESLTKARKDATRLIDLRDKIRASTGPLKQYAGIYKTPSDFLSMLGFSKGADGCYAIPTAMPANSIFSLRAAIGGWGVTHLGLWTDDKNVHLYTFAGTLHPQEHRIQSRKSVKGERGTGEEMLLGEDPRTAERITFFPSALKIVDATGKSVVVNRCDMENMAPVGRLPELLGDIKPPTFYPALWWWQQYKNGTKL